MCLKNMFKINNNVFLSSKLKRKRVGRLLRKKKEKKKVR